MPFRTLSLAALAALLLAACGNPLSLENYNRLKLGQSYDEVRAIIGEPARCDETLGVRSCEWGDAQHGVSVNFLGGKVILLSARNLR
jgi:hypothetical protein